MNRHLIDYVNALTMTVFTQSVELENQRRLLDHNTDTLMRCRNTIDALMEATFGNVEVYHSEQHNS